MAQYTKPLPTPTEQSKPFWDACKQHELRIQRCTKCGHYQHYPLAICSQCWSFDLEWAKVSGRGKIYTWVVCHVAFHPGFADDLPYTFVTVELDEGVRMTSQMVDVEPEELYPGMPVEVVFDDVTEEVTLPKFKRAS